MISTRFIRKTASTLLLSFAYVAAYAQDVSDFGKVEAALMSKTQSQIDKAAEAEVVFEVSDVSFSVMGGTAEIHTKRHLRIKIYNTNGLDQANISIPYFNRNGLESISKLEGQTYNLNDAGSITVSKLDKKSVYDTRIDNRYSKLTFTLPEVKAGSVIEYRYTVKKQIQYLFELTSQHLSNWSFQKSIPVMYSKFIFYHPSEFTFKELPLNNIPIEFAQKNVGNGTQKTFVCRNLPAVKDEPFMTTTKDYKQKVRIDVIGYNPPGEISRDLRMSWPKIINTMMEDEDFGFQLKRNIQRTQELDLALQHVVDPYQKMTMIHEYVKKNMAWDEATSIWAMEGVKRAWEQKRGNSGEINLILVNLLKESGLKAYPVLVSTKEHGRLRPMDPSFDQFNTVMAYVTIDSNFYVLDATDKYTPSNLIPPSVVYTEGLVISKLDGNKSLQEQDWGWKTLYNEKQQYQKLINVTARFDGKGTINGDAFIMFRDYARERISEQVEPIVEKTTAFYASSTQGAKITDLNVKNEKNIAQPLEHMFKFQVPTEANGDYFVYNINVFTGLEKNPFTAQERYADIFFGYAQKFTLRGNVELPDEYTFEAPPKSLKMVMPDNSIELSRIVQVEGQSAKYVIQIDIKKPFYSPDEYDVFYEFFKKMYSLLNEPIVIKKK